MTSTATAQTPTTEYVGRRRSGGYATGNYEGCRQWESVIWTHEGARPNTQPSGLAGIRNA